MKYIYYFSKQPKDFNLPEGYIKLLAHREPVYDGMLHREIYGQAIYPHPLSLDQVHKHDLIADPHNDMPSMRRS